MSIGHSSHALNIFVHRASEYLTDSESHGDGLICFSLLNGLAERGHNIFAYTNKNVVVECNPRLNIKAEPHKVPFNSLVNWEHWWKAGKWLKEIKKSQVVDLVWRMHPYGAGCPLPPQTFGKPLVVGPLFYEWPKPLENKNLYSTNNSPRFGVGLSGILTPLALRGWQHTLGKASLVICSTPQHTKTTQVQLSNTDVITVPVITKPSSILITNRSAEYPKRALRIIFVANLLPHKNPLLFCEVVRLLALADIDVEAVILGEGSMRTILEKYCQNIGIRKQVCFKGRIDNAEVYEQLRQADFLISTSLGEPYGRSIVEAMSVGTPAICHGSGGPADIINNGVNGWLVKELTAQAYTKIIMEVYKQPNIWQSVSTQALQNSKQWTEEVVLNQLETTLLQTRKLGFSKEKTLC